MTRAMACLLRGRPVLDAKRRQARPVRFGQLGEANQRRMRSGRRGGLLRVAGSPGVRWVGGRACPPFARGSGPRAPRTSRRVSEGALKRELRECFHFEDRAEAERRLAAFVEDYNHRRGIDGAFLPREMASMRAGTGSARPKNRSAGKPPAAAAPRHPSRRRSRPRAARLWRCCAWSCSTASWKTSPGDPRIAVAYVRASKDEQCLSPEAQRAGKPRVRTGAAASKR
jgi:hypothetical protein